MTAPAALIAVAKVDTGDTAWMLVQLPRWC